MSEQLPYTVLKPISYKGDRIEKGSVIRMTPEEAENIGDEFLEPAEEADVQETASEESNTDTHDADKPEGDGEQAEIKEDDTSSADGADGAHDGPEPDENL